MAETGKFCEPWTGLQRLTQAPDIFPPAGDQTIGIGLVAFVAHATFSKCQLVLSVHQRG